MQLDHGILSQFVFPGLCLAFSQKVVTFVKLELAVLVNAIQGEHVHANVHSSDQERVQAKMGPLLQRLILLGLKI